MLETQTITQMMTKTQQTTQTNNEFCVIILLYKNPNFVNNGFQKPFDLELCGKKMWKCVESACRDYQVKTTLCTEKSNVLELIKPMLTNSKYTLVLYSDTPLLTQSTIKNIFDYATKNQVDFVKLTRGFLVNTKYAKKIKEFEKTTVQHFEDEDFSTVFDLRQLEFVNQILKSKIIEFHQKNGVCILDNASTFIDVDCVIESGVVIHPNNSILKNTYIGKHAVLYSGNVVISSEIGERAILHGAYIKNAKIEDGKEIFAFERIE